MIVTLCSSPVRPKIDTIKKATNGKNANFMTDVKKITDLERLRPEKSIETPKESIINGIAPSPK